MAVLGEQRVPVEPGDVVFIPKGVDHKFENFESEKLVELVIFTSEPGLDENFRRLTS